MTGGCIMIESIRLKRKKTEPIAIGDVVQYHGGTFVVINILGIDAQPDRKKDDRVFYYCLGQLYGSPDLAADYLTTENELQFTPEQYGSIPQVGDIFFDNTIGIWVRILEIREAFFVGKSLRVRFKFTPIKEWSREKMERAFNDARERHMKLIKGPALHK